MKRVSKLPLFVLALLVTVTLAPAIAAPVPASKSTAQWLWSSSTDIAPKNRFTWFRKVVTLDAVPADATLRFAADSNARLWINGRIVRRKVARYFEDKATAEIIDAAPYLRKGENVIVALHHNWGPIVIFQRSGNEHAGLYLDASWVKTDASWKCATAPEYLPHDKRIVGIIGDARIRYPVIMDGGKRLKGDIHSPSFDDASWQTAVAVTDGPWPEYPAAVETPGQREYPVTPLTVLAAGETVTSGPVSGDPFSMAADLKNARFIPDEASRMRAEGLLAGKTVAIEGNAGSSRYITFDFGLPVHGFPFLAIIEATAGVVVDFGYCEIPESLYDGRLHVRRDGWIDTEGVVGPGYGDRYITAKGSQEAELPDERTARWMILHVRFPENGRIVLSGAGIVKSQYPVTTAGTFFCGDERVEQIVKLCRIHAEVTMSDSYVDTPGREDGQWIEDACPRAEIGARWFGANELRRFLIRTYAESQGKDGNFHPFPPSNFPAYPATYDWSVQWVKTLYEDYRWTGKTDLVAKYFDTLVRYWDNVLSHTGDDGLWRTRNVLADIRIGHHAENDRQSSGIITPWIIERLRMSAIMADAAGKREQAAKWRAAADKMAEAFRNYHIVPASGSIPLHVADRSEPGNTSLERGYSQAGQTVALTTGLLTPEEARADLEYAFTGPQGDPSPGVTRWNNPTNFYRSLTVLSRFGFGERASAHLVERFSPYLPGHPNNTLPRELQGPYGGPVPEYWVSREDLGLSAGEPNTAQPRDPTGSHGWGATPLLWMHESLLGVTIAEPGGAKLSITPDAAGLPYVSGTTCTPKGLVWVRWEPAANELEIEIPAGVSVEVGVPRDREGRTMVAVSSPVKAMPLASGGFRIAGAGRYEFRVR